MKKITQQGLLVCRSNDGYIALSLVSIVSLIMLIVSVSIAGRVVETAADVGNYESLRTARVVALSCVSIAQERVVEGSLEAVNGVLWQVGYEQGTCQVDTTETLLGYAVRIVSRVDDASMSAALSASVEKDTGRVVALNFL